LKLIMFWALLIVNQEIVPPFGKIMNELTLPPSVRYFVI